MLNAITERLIDFISIIYLRLFKVNYFSLTVNGSLVELK